MSNFSRPWHVPPLEELEWLQGSSSDLSHDTLLLLLIQTNCPGCHIHAIPTANQLAATKQEGFDLYCVSTAFEDFDYNTKDNTKLLLERGTLVGVAKEQLGPTAQEIPTGMPVAYDMVADTSELSPEELERARNASKDIAREQMTGQGVVHPGVLEKMLYKVDPNLLLPDKVARVFWAVRALGTPMWVIHRRSSGEVLDRKFGQHSPEELLAWIQPHLI